MIVLNTHAIRGKRAWTAAGSNSIWMARFTTNSELQNLKDKDCPGRLQQFNYSQNRWKNIVISVQNIFNQSESTMKCVAPNVEHRSD